MIKNIALSNVGIHATKEVEFKLGLNIITGANEGGKTTLLDAISFAYFGNTSHSSKDKFIRFGEKRAEVSLISDTEKFVRVRHLGGTELKGISVEELDKIVHLDYKEFLKIFYIPSNESFTLLDQAYFRNFLLNIFNLDRYAKIHSRLKQQYDALNIPTDTYKEPNRELLYGRFKKVKTACEKYTKRKNEIDAIVGGFRKKINVIYSRRGELNSKLKEIRAKRELLQWDKCITCTQTISEQYKQKLSERLNTVQGQVEAALRDLLEDERKVNMEIGSAAEVCDLQVQKIERGKRILYRLKELAERKSPRVDTDALKILAQKMSVFEAKGFPSYLLQIYLPTIQETANNLLGHIFPDMRIKIRPFKPETNVPDFKVLINKGGNEVELCDLCGAESVLVNVCLRLGLIGIFKRLNSTCIDFLMADEVLDRLDDQNYPKLLCLFENFIRQGFLKQVIFITHRKELKQLEGIHYIIV